ncbi:DASS family sodium-coupled anion symporter [Spongiibacter sp.]|uniref:SLC13 family permease n=1 Tax=Spongiibacter sp. TaxID=2024860 RepID=UPI00356ACA93
MINRPQAVSGAAARRRCILAAGPALLVLSVLLPPPAGMAVAAWQCAALALWMALWWATEAIAIPVTALLPLLLAPLIGLSEIQTMAAAYAHPVVFLFMGGFMLGLGMQRWQLHRRLALVILCRVGAAPRRQIAGFMAATAFLSMWVSNTATAVMMLPIAMSVIALLPESLPARRNYAVALLLAIAYSASIGGMATLIGTPPNALLAAYLQSSHGIALGFAQWMSLALPVSAAMLAACWWLLCRGDFRGVADYSSVDVSRRALDELGPISPAERRIATVFVLAACGWIARPLIDPWLPGLSDTGVALLAALSLFVLPSGRPGQALLDWQTAEKLPWGVLLLFGGGLALAALIGSSGLASWIAGQLELLAVLPVAVLLLVVVAVMVFLTELTSNTATTAAFLPLLGAMAVAQGQAPLLLCAGAALAASCAFMMPVATPPNAVVFGSGELAIRDMMAAGFRLNLLGIALVSLCSYGVITLLWLA